jgi:hypothetical protein
MLTNIQNNQSNENNDNLIKLEALEKEYDVVLNQYQESLKSYINALNQPKNYVSLKGRAYWGKQSLKEGNVASKEDCINMCKSDSKCSGATYNEKKNYCWTRQGTSSLTASDENDYAILSQDKTLLTRLQYFNSKLSDMSEEIIKELNELKPNLKEDQNKNDFKQKQIEIHYTNLQKQKKDIEKELDEYMAIENEYINQQLYANQNNISLRVWFIITAIILLVTFKKMVGQQSVSLSILFWIILVGLVIVLSISINQ